MREFLPPATPDLSPDAVTRWPAIYFSAQSSHVSNPPYHEARSLFAYTGDIRSAILTSKYTARPFPARAVAQRLQEALQNQWKDLFPDNNTPVIVPVPIHPIKYFRRGFNLPALVGAELARLLGWPCDPLILHRHSERLPQAGLPLKDRENNVKNAFRVPKGKNAPPRILLLDDVLTTGATASEASSVLKYAGATHIVVVTIAASMR